MSLQAAYKQFLAAPNASFLAPDASLHYITTLVTKNSSAEIIKHLNGQSNTLKKKEEKILDAVEGANALAVEVHTTIEFLAGGGAYLPNLDDNFLADHTVTLPIIHIVTFNANGKIAQIRQSWDQGSLLKLIDVIGKSGRNWPIRDGKDQIKLITNSVKSAGKPVAPGTDEVPEHIRSRGNSNNVTRDPHASLALFAPRQQVEEAEMPSVVAPKASAKPPQRDYHDLFVGNDSDNSQPSPTKATQVRDESPSKNPRASKAGAGKNYGPSRLFDADEDGAPSPDKPSHNAYKPNSARYNHFDFAEPDVGEVHATPKPLKEVQSAKHGSQWNFDDFNTPAKIVPGKVMRTNEVRHWGNSDDENVNSPMMMKKVDKPRVSAETHFEFQDDGTPAVERRPVGRPRGQGQNTGLGLYKDNMFDEEDTPVGKVKPTLANVKERNKVFDPHFAMTDNSPVSTPGLPREMPEDRAKAVKMMDANWSAYDKSPAQKENVPTRSNNGEIVKTSINIAGDGMGGKKGLSEAATTNRGINIGGDGMGGKKGTGRAWGFGDDSDGEEAGGVNKPSKFRTGKGQHQQATGGDFWDF